MKKIVLLLIPVALLGADQKRPAAKPAPAAKAAEKSAAPAAPAAKAAERPGPSTIPEDAELIAPATYRHIDKSGKSWIYRRTPFGLSRVEEMQAPPAGAIPAITVKATDLGDSVRFEKPTPMGTGVWVKKKSELTDAEKEFLEKSGPKVVEK